MIGALIAFLIGCLVLAIVLYVIHLVLNMLTLPGEIKQIALVIIGLVGLLVLILLAWNVFAGGGSIHIGPAPIRASLGCMASYR